MANDLMTNMTTDVNVGMNEVVSVFVAKYEDGLFAKKEELSKSIKTVKRNLEDLTKKLEESVDSSKYETSIPVLGLTTKMTDVNVKWDGTYKNKKPIIEANVGVFDDSSDRDYANFTKTFTFDISKEDVDMNFNLKTELETLNAELLEVMGQIKSVSRKERQIRGKISEMKLEQSGYTGLLNNPEMLQLVQL